MENTQRKVAQGTGIQETLEIPKLKMMEKGTFGIGDFGSSFSWSFIAMFATIYFTDIVGISAGIIGTMMLIARIFDGISDLFMGNVIDRTNSKMGKAKPWLFWSTPPLAIATFMLFNVPSFLGSTGQIVYVFVLYLLISAVFYTANNISYNSLISFMTTDPKDRVSLGSYRFIFAIAGVLLMSSFTTVLVDTLGGGQRGWTFTAAIFAVICLIPLMITGWFVKERNIAKKENENQNTSFGFTLKVLFSNKYFILAVLLYLFMYLKQTRTAVQIYYTSYIFENPSLMGILSIATLLPTMIGLLFAPQIVGKLGIRKSILGGLVIGVIGNLLIGLYSEDLTGFIIGLIINSLGMVTITAGAAAVIADIGDLVYWKSGVPVQGSVFSIASAGIKIGTGISSAMVGWVLGLSNYVPNAEVQSEEAIFGFKFLFIYFPLICSVALIIVIAFMNQEKFMPKIREEIKIGRIGELRNKAIDKI